MTNQTPSPDLAGDNAGLADQQKRRAELATRISMFCDHINLPGEDGDAAYDLLREAAARIGSDRLRFERTTQADILLRYPLDNLARAEANYRSAHDLFGAGDIRTGRAWDKMRQAGDTARAALRTTQADSVLRQKVKDILRGQPGEEYTDRGMEDAFFRWPVIDRAIEAALKAPTTEPNPDAVQVGWQPIKTVPPDVQVLVLLPGESSGVMQVGKHRTVANGLSWVIGNRFGFDLEVRPTHWMPLPEVPTPEQSQ